MNEKDKKTHTIILYSTANRCRVNVEQCTVLNSSALMFTLLNFLWFPGEGEDGVHLSDESISFLQKSLRSFNVY